MTIAKQLPVSLTLFSVSTKCRYNTTLIAQYEIVNCFYPITNRNNYTAERLYDFQNVVLTENYEECPQHDYKTDFQILELFVYFDVQFSTMQCYN